MKAWLHRGLIYLSGVPGPDDTQFSRRLYSQVSSSASWHGRHRRWNMPLCHDVVKGLQALGVPMPPDLARWEAQQKSLEVRRRDANRLKALTARELRERLAAVGVRLKEDVHQFMDHQILSVAYALKLPACGLFLDTGTGKTAVGAAIMQALADLRGQNRFLVIAPKSILEVGWHDDLTRFSWLRVVNISDPPVREPVTSCPHCGRRFKGHVGWAHLKTHMAQFIAKHGEPVAREQLYKRHPELLPPAWERAPVTTCSLCGQQFTDHVTWDHLKAHCQFTDKDSESKARRKFYKQHPEHAPITSGSKKARVLRALADPGHQVFLINPESFKLVVDELKDTDWDLVIVDESSMLKSPKSDITNEMIGFGGRAHRRICMTATPRPNGSLDLWGQMAFLDQCLGGSYTKFRDAWFYPDFTGYKWLPKAPDVDHKIWDIVAERSYRVRLEDCVNLPGETTEKIGVRLEGRLWEHYLDMLNKMMTEIENGDIVDTSWEIVQLNKLAQITSGYIFDNDGNPQFLSESPKITATVDMAKRLIESEDRDVVIWVRFPETEGDRLQDELSKYGVSTAHGHTRDMEASVRAFTSRQNRVMIAHPLTAKFGHTWVNSNVAIFHSYDYSWENFFQAKRRIYRKGQTKPVTYVVNVALGTIDEEILARVFAKENASETVVDEHLFQAIKRRSQSRLQN